MELRSDDLPEHLAADIAELLVEDPRVGEQGLHVSVNGRTVTISGAVATDERRTRIGAVIAEKLPDLDVDNRVAVLAGDLDAPGEAERLP